MNVANRSTFAIWAWSDAFPQEASPAPGAADAAVETAPENANPNTEYPTAQPTGCTVNIRQPKAA